MKQPGEGERSKPCTECDHTGAAAGSPVTCGVDRSAEHAKNARSH